MRRTERHATGCVVFDNRRKHWQYFWYQEGKRRSKVIGTRSQYPTKGAAWRAILADRPEPKSQNRSSETMASLVRKYEAERMPERHSTRRTYRSFLQTHIVPRWGKVPIQDVQPLEVELWLRGLKRSPKTRSHLRNLMHILFEFAMLAKLFPIQRNPMSLVVVKGATKRVRKPRSLTVEEFHRLLAQLHEPFVTLALICVCLGLRISECLGLRWSDIDWLGSTLTIRRAIVEKHVDVPKTETSASAFTLSHELLRKLQFLRTLTLFAAEQDWLFASPVKIGRLPYSYTGVWRELKRAAAAAGIGWVATHTFRHTYRSWLDSVGTPLAVQQKAMRHTDIRTTMNYGDVVDDRIDQALGKVSELAFTNSTQAARGDA